MWRASFALVEGSVDATEGKALHKPQAGGGWLRHPAARHLHESASSITTSRQPCATFAIHHKLPELRRLYEAGDAAFVANIGQMVEVKADTGASAVSPGEPPAAEVSEGSPAEGSETEKVKKKRKAKKEKDKKDQKKKRGEEEGGQDRAYH